MIGQQTYLKNLLALSSTKKIWCVALFRKVNIKTIYDHSEPNYIFWVAIGKILLTSLVHDALLSTSVKLERVTSDSPTH